MINSVTIHGNCATEVKLNDLGKASHIQFHHRKSNTPENVSEDEPKNSDPIPA